MNGKPFYKTWWGIILLFVFWPFSLTYWIWKKNWNLKLKLGLLILLWFFILLVGLVKPQEQSNNKNVLGQSSRSSNFANLNKTSTVLPTSESLIIPTSVPTAFIIPSDTPFPIPQDDIFSVTRIVDGDTIDVNINGKIERIRLIGIDTPETLDPRKPVQCFGKEAGDKAKEILTGKKVSLESDPTQGDKDKYDRLLRYVFLEDGTNFNQMMIEEGYAHEYTYAIPYKYQTEFKQAEKDARDGNKGLWNPDACVSFTPVPKPTVKYVSPTQSLIQPQDSTDIQSSGGFSCNCGKTCTEISSCEEAQFQLNSCSCKQRDADHDGIACDSAPLHCQN